MRSPLIFHNVQPLDLELFGPSRIRELSVKNVKQNFHQLSTGELSVHTISNEVANIDVIECFANDPAVIDFELSRGNVFFEVVISKDWQIVSQDMVSDDFHEPTCSFVFYRKGHYQYHIRPGVHTLMLISINKEWLSHKAGLYPFLNELMDKQAANAFYRTQKCPYKNQIKRNLTAFLYEDEHVVSAKVIGSLLDRLLKRYQVMLLDGEMLGREVRTNLLQRLRDFVKDHYADEVILNNSRIAEHFFISERSLRRLADEAFGHGIKQEVIAVKMSFAFKYLALMDKSAAEVARLTGYEDVKYFRKVFKGFWKINVKEVYKPKKPHN